MRKSSKTSGKRKFKSLDDKKIEAAIRKSIKKPEGELTGEDLGKITELGLSSIQIGDISVLKELTKLTVLTLTDNRISDITALKELTHLLELYLGFNQVRDVRALKELQQLTKLNLEENQISDVRALKELQQLRELDIDYNPITLSKIKELEKALPDCETIAGWSMPQLLSMITDTEPKKLDERKKTMKTTLYYKQGTSDKVYETWLEITPSGKEAMVYFAFGRRGSNLQGGPKTNSPMPLGEAQSYMERLIDGKIRKGYQAESAKKKYSQSSKKPIISRPDMLK